MNVIQIIQLLLKSKIKIVPNGEINEKCIVTPLPCPCDLYKTIICIFLILDHELLPNGHQTHVRMDLTDDSHRTLSQMQTFPSKEFFAQLLFQMPLTFSVQHAIMTLDSTKIESKDMLQAWSGSSCVQPISGHVWLEQNSFENLQFLIIQIFHGTQWDW